jgi:hypothetical protein
VLLGDGAESFAWRTPSDGVGITVNVGGTGLFAGRSTPSAGKIATVAKATACVGNGSRISHPLTIQAHTPSKNRIPDRHQALFFSMARIIPPLGSQASNAFAPLNAGAKILAQAHSPVTIVFDQL